MVWLNRTQRKHWRDLDGAMSTKKTPWVITKWRQVKSSLTAWIGRYLSHTKNGQVAPRTGLWAMTGSLSARPRSDCGKCHQTITGSKSKANSTSPVDGTPTFVLGLPMEDVYGERRET